MCTLISVVKCIALFHSKKRRHVIKAVKAAEIIQEIVSLTLCLLVSSTDSLCQQFGPRSGRKKCRA